MSKSWTAIIGVMVCFSLMALYRLTGIFVNAGHWVNAIYDHAFVLPGPLKVSPPLQYGYYTIAAFVSAFVCTGLMRWTAKVGFLFTAVFLTLLLSPVLAFKGFQFEPFSGVAAILLAGIAGMFYSASDDGQKGHELLHWLGGRMSQAKLNKLLAAPSEADLNSKREMTVVVCRMLNYTELCLNNQPVEIEEAVTQFLKEASEHLIAQGGYLDACNVEGVRAIFGLGEPLGDHAQEACRAALGLQKKLEALRDRSPVKAVFGMAIATGPLSIGIFGPPKYAQLGVVGEALDFSRRLCSINAVYGSKVLLSARAYHLTKDNIEARPMEMFSAPRLHQISEVYELLGEKGQLSEAETKARDDFWHGVVSLRKGAYKEAVGHLKRAQVEGREDAPLKYFLDRAEAGAREDRLESEGKPATKHIRALTAG